MGYHVVARFATHEKAEHVAITLEQDAVIKVSISSSVPHKDWLHRDKWLESAFGAVGGVAATVSNLVPGFGALFMGGPLDGALQGRILADWLLVHPQETDAASASFVIVSCEQSDVGRVKDRLFSLGGSHIHVTQQDGE